MIRRIEILLERGVAPSSKEAQILKEDLTWLTDETFGDNQQLIESFWMIRKSTDASNELGLYPIDASILAYIDSLYQDRFPHANAVNRTASPLKVPWMSMLEYIELVRSYTQANTSPDTKLTSNVFVVGK